MGLKLSNNASGLLAVAISDSDTSLTLEAGHGSRFPALSAGYYFPITVVRASDPSQLEIMRCIARSGDTLTVERAQEGTSALAFDPGDVVELRLTAGTLEEHFPQVEGRNAKNLRFIIGSVGGKPELKFKSGDNEEAVVRRSDLTISPTDTTPGRLLKVGDFGVGYAIPIPQGANLNDYIIPGEYQQSSNAYALPELNYPVQLAGSLKVMRASFGVVQEYTTYGNTRRKFLRGVYTGEWSDWVEFYNTGNIDQLISDANLVQTSDPRLSDAREWTADVVSQAEAEAGTSTVPRKWTAERVRQAIEALGGGGAAGDVEWDDIKNKPRFGTAIYYDVTTSSTDGTYNRLMRTGDFGVGYPVFITDGQNLNDFKTSGEYIQYSSSLALPELNYPAQLTGFLKVVHAAGRGVQEYTAYGDTTIRKFFRVVHDGAWSYWFEFYHTLNTTVDANGHLLVASPIIRLYDDRIEVEGNFHQPPQFERLDVGVYRITGTLGLRLDDGWYLETPTDRNGNKYFNVEWEQDVEPENEAGIVDEPVDVELIIRTYERVWNPQSGRHENGDPVDINERQTRHIALRFNELRRKDPEPPTHDPS